MGSWCSGRTRTRQGITSALVLDVGQMVRQGNLVPGKHRAGTMVWTRGSTGEQRASLDFEVNMGSAYDAWMRLHYSAGGTSMDYRVTLWRTPCRFGGFRWWFVCPHTSQFATKLYLPPGANMFLSRRAYRMAYGSERGGPTERSHTRQARLYAKLGGQYRVFEQCPPRRPKGMHRRTYERLLAQVDRAMDTHHDIFIAGAVRFLAKDPAMRARLGL